MQTRQHNIYSRELTRQNYDRLSRYYDWLTLGPERKIQQEGITRLQVLEGESVLEVGFGTGRTLVSLAQAAGDTGRIYGIDLSPGMLQTARMKVKRAGLEDRIELVEGDAVRLPFVQNSMDAVFMSFTLELFTDEEIMVVLTECRRVLKTGGRICLVSLSASRSGCLSSIYKWAHRAFPSVVDCRPIYPREAVQSAGFSEIQSVLRYVWGLPVEIVSAVNYESAL
ncbi:MAG: methyltransferase domain-containing protein [Syntrophomonadaceae bacterium]